MKRSCRSVLRPESSEFLFCGVKSMGSTQNEPKLDHIGRVCDAVGSTVLDRPENESAVLFFAKHDHGTVKGNLTDLINQAKESFIVALGIRIAQVEQDDV
jgi:hypothetical protein